MSPFCPFALLWILVSDPRKLCLTQGHRNFSPLSSFRGFIVLAFTVRSMIYKKSIKKVILLFLSGTIYQLNFLFAFLVSSCSSTICWKPVLSHRLSFLSFFRNYSACRPIYGFSSLRSLCQSFCYFHTALITIAL